MLKKIHWGGISCGDAEEGEKQPERTPNYTLLHQILIGNCGVGQRRGEEESEGCVEAAPVPTRDSGQ